jgi:hypothetical protein
MRTLITVVGAVVAFSGCAARQKLFPGELVTILPVGEAERPCVERLLAQSRLTGYIEQTVDKDMGFFRVGTKHPLFTVTGKKPPKAPEGKQIALSVSHYNVQCTAPNSATITPVGGSGVLTASWLIDEYQRDELEQFASALGIRQDRLIAPPPPPPPAATQPPAELKPPKCVASEMPEWSAASAARKKELLASCRSE